MRGTSNSSSSSLTGTFLQFSRSVVSDSLRPHELQHARPPCPSPAPGVHPNPCPLSQWCHPTISSSVVPFSSCPQSFLASGSFPMSQLFASGGQSIGVSASTSVLPMNTQHWFPLGFVLFKKFCFIYFLAMPHGMQDLSSPTRGGTHIPCSGRAESLTTKPPGKSHSWLVPALTP